MSQSNIHRLILVGLALGLGSIAAYLNVHDQGAFFLWFGTFICFWVVVS